jgi:hypothetical protein
MQRGYNTNLASEFYVLSMLYRLGFDANLTLGNKKSVDIAVVLGRGRAITVDVKAVAGKMDWLMGSSPNSPKPNHYVVLVSYDGRFGDAQQAPRCWVLPHHEVLPLVKTARGKGHMRFLSRKQVLDSFGPREGRLATPGRGRLEVEWTGARFIPALPSIHRAMAGGRDWRDSGRGSTKLR